jgi:hypothetical protein
VFLWLRLDAVSEQTSLRVELAISCSGCWTHTTLNLTNNPPVSVNLPNRRYNQITGARFKELAKSPEHYLWSVCFNCQLWDEWFSKAVFCDRKGYHYIHSKESVNNILSICLQVLISWVIYKSVQWYHRQESVVPALHYFFQSGFITSKHTYLHGRDLVTFIFDLGCVWL